MKRLRKSQNILVGINGITFLTTAALIREGVGSMSSVNLAIIAALGELEKLMDQDNKPRGLLGSWHGHYVRLDIC